MPSFVQLSKSIVARISVSVTVFKSVSYVCLHVNIKTYHCYFLANAKLTGAGSAWLTLFKQVDKEMHPAKQTSVHYLQSNCLPSDVHI